MTHVELSDHSYSTRGEDTTPHTGGQCVVREHHTDQKFRPHWPILRVPGIVEPVKLDDILLHFRQGGRVRLAGSHGRNLPLGRLTGFDGADGAGMLGSMRLDTVEGMWMGFGPVDAIGSRSAHVGCTDRF